MNKVIVMFVSNGWNVQGQKHIKVDTKKVCEQWMECQWQKHSKSKQKQCHGLGVFLFLLCMEC